MFDTEYRVLSDSGVYTGERRKRVRVMPRPNQCAAASALFGPSPDRPFLAFQTAKRV